ncbi:MAG: hypothetical protein LLF98_02520 [Clostridium sp.]|uniref:hypothetical protein n=1 Tax=Clostridium sp. TaxID=1506 RepID=UPI0025BA6A5F|nr:hypothetical protein [Clostridium sp.]MCE5220157.1 hypothetical protein [Clostridium sp.]
MLKMFFRKKYLVIINLFMKSTGELLYTHKCLCYDNGKKLQEKIDKEIIRLADIMPGVNTEVLSIEEIKCI